MINVLQSVLQASGSIVACKFNNEDNAETIQQALIDLVVYCIEVQLGEMNSIDDELIHAGIVAVMMRSFKDPVAFDSASQASFSLNKRESGVYKADFFYLVDESDSLKKLPFETITKIYDSWVSNGSTIQGSS